MGKDAHTNGPMSSRSPPILKLFIIVCPSRVKSARYDAYINDLFYFFLFFYTFKIKETVNSNFLILRIDNVYIQILQTQYINIK